MLRLLTGIDGENPGGKGERVEQDARCFSFVLLSNIVVKAYSTLSFKVV